MPKTVYRIGAFCPFSQTSVTLYFTSIDEARRHNPTLRDFRLISVHKQEVKTK